MSKNVFQGFQDARREPDAKFSYKNFAVVFWVVCFGQCLAEQENPEKILRPMVVSVDRRPDKDITYTKCLAIFKRKKGGFITTAVEMIGDRVCPAASDVVLDVDDSDPKIEKTTTDRGQTISKNKPLPASEFSKTFAYLGKDWQFASTPREVTVSAKSPKEPSKMITDTFCSTLMWNEESKEKLSIACNNCETVTACFESRLDSKKPLAVGDVKTTSHAKPSDVPEFHI